MRTRKIGEYEVHKYGRAFRLYQVSEVSEDTVITSGTEFWFSNFNEAIVKAYEMNGWGFPKFINA